METTIKPTHITDYFERNAQKYAAKPAIIFENEQISWSQLWQLTQKPYAYISSRVSSKKQEIVALLLPNSVDFVVTYLAILRSGHIALPLDPAYKSLELDKIIEQLPQKMIITNQELLKQFSETHQKTATLVKDLSSYQGVAGELVRMPADEQIATLTFTSGTTGKPKAAPNTHANHIWNIKICSEVWDWTDNDTLLVTVPLSHMLGIVMGLSGIIYHGNTMYLHGWFDEEKVLKALASGKISFFSHAASAYVKLAAHRKKDYDLSKVRLCVSGAAPLPPAVWHEFKDRYGIEILETYGTTETGRIAGNRLNERVLGSPGKPLPGVDLRINEDGEVEVKSPGVFPGYYQNQTATKKSLSADGFWRTGDIAELRDGYVFLKGRVQERIRRFGYTVSPRDVEWAIHKHPKVKDIFVMGRTVVGKPNDELIYFVVGNITDDELKDFSKQNLLFAWRADKVVHLKDLPRTRSGKVSLGKLKEMLA